MSCGLGVVLDDNYAGVDNCSADPNCLTRRIYHRGSGASDFIAVPDWPDGDGDGGAGGGSGEGDGADGGGGPGDGGPVGPRCTPRPPARIAPSFGQADLDQGQINVNPYHQQLTGLESWFWWGGDADLAWESPVAVGIAADCSIIPPPPSETYRASLVELRWEVGDGRPASYVSTHPGTEDDPAVRHVYRTKGTWNVTVTCVWQGEWGETVTLPCGERELETIEVRSRLTN